jgi:hydroxyacylglutathione hydrolase
MIIRGLEVGPFFSNCYIVGCEKTKEGMVIDPGAESGRILKTAQELGLSIKTIVATHTHADHIGALAKVKEATGAEFAVHEAEGSKEMMQASSQMLAAMLGQSSSGPSPQADRLLRDGDVIEVGELRFTVLHTPGHSLGGISLVGHGVVFCGDTLFNMSIGRTDFPGGDYETIMHSIHSKLMILPDETRVFCGHMQETTIGFERRRNPFVLGLF